MKKKVCFVNSVEIWGGSENWQVETMLALKDQFEIVSISNPQGVLQEKIKGEVEVYSFNADSLSFLNPLKVYEIYSLLKRLAIHSIIFTTSSDFKMFTLPAKWAGVKNIIYRRDRGSILNSHCINKYFLHKGITDFLPCSEFIKRSSLEKNKNLVPLEKISVIYNSISILKWDCEKSEFPYAKDKGITYFGCIGRLSEEKGQLFLPEIVQKLVEKHTNIKILIAGIGPMEEPLKKKIEELNLSSYFEFLGFVRHSKDFMETVDCLLLPSLVEGLPTVAIEAMASQKPVIAFDIAGNPEVVQDQVTGYIIPAFDTDKFRVAMELLVDNLDLRVRLGKQGRVLAENVFSHEKTLKQLGAILER